MAVGDAYPTRADIQSRIDAFGLTLTAAQSDELDALVETAVRDFEQRVGRKMLAPATTEQRRYDPPVNTRGLLLIDDLARGATAVVTYQPEGAASESLVQGTDYFLEPVTDWAGGPYTALRTTRRWSSPLQLALYGSVKITGRWGYATSIPADAWSAMVLSAVASVIRFASGAVSSVAAGVKRKKIEDFEVEYATTGYDSMVSGLTRQVDDVVNRYKRVVM